MENKEIVYNDAQYAELKRRCECFSTALSGILGVSIILTMIALAAIYCMIVGWTFIGIILLIVLFLPIVLAYASTLKLLSYKRTIDKKRFKVFAQACNSSQNMDIEDIDPKWMKEVIIDNEKIDYYPEKEDHFPKCGDVVHVIRATNKSKFVFATDPIEDTSSNEQ